MTDNDGRDLDQSQIFKQAFNKDTKTLGVTQENSLIRKNYDAIRKTLVSAVIEQYDYYLGGLAGTIVTTLVVIKGYKAFRYKNTDFIKSVKTPIKYKT